MRRRQAKLSALVGLFVLLIGADALAQTRGAGLTFASPEAYRSIPLAAPPLMGALPEAVDMSAEFPTPGDQGMQGSCVGWAVAYAVRSRDAGRRLGVRPQGADRVFSPAYIFNQINRSPGCQGSLYTDALNLLTAQGAAPLSAFPYDPSDCRRQPDAAAHQAAAPWRVQTWRRVNVQDTTEVKAHLAAGFPVLIGMVIDEGFQALRGDATYSATAGRPLGGHALVLVGYDDARRAFKLINSWGTGWGAGGFGWIDEALFRQVVREGYVISDFNSKPSPTPSPRDTPPAPALTQIAPAVTPNPLAVPAAALAQTPYGPGIDFQVSGLLAHAQGHAVQVVIRFGVQLPDGSVQQIPANQQSPFRDFNGGVATGTQPFRPRGDRMDLRLVDIAPIPRVAIPASGLVVIQADLYVDGFNIARSPMGPLQLPQVGQYCCDQLQQRRCALRGALPLGSQCLCPGLGGGHVCP